MVVMQNLHTKTIAASWMGKSPSILLGHKMQENQDTFALEKGVRNFTGETVKTF